MHEALNGILSSVNYELIRNMFSPYKYRTPRSTILLVSGFYCSHGIER